MRCNESIKILVVEDEVLIGLMLAKKLRSLGYTVSDVITSGEEAVEVAEKLEPSVVLMDVALAGAMSGIEAAKEIKRRFGIPIIIFTGYSDSFLYEQTRQIEPVAILAKMDPLSALVAAIEKAVS